MLICVLVVLVVVFAMGVYFGKTLAKSESELAALSLQSQVENSMPEVSDEEIEVISEGATPDVAPDDDDFVKIMVPGQSPTPSPGDIQNDDTETSPAPLDTPVPAPEPVATPLPSPPTGGKFTIQLSSHPGKVEAENARSNYSSQGVTNVYIVSYQKGGQTWFRVRTGAFATKSAAKQVADAIKSKGIVANPWVTTK